MSGFKNLVSKLKRIIWLKQTPRAHDYGLIPLYLCPPREDDEIRRRIPAYIVEKKTIPRATKKSKRNQNRIKPRTFLFWSVKYWPKKNRRLSLSSNFPGLRRIFPRKPSWKKMHDFCFTIPYGLVLIGGGVVGYMKKGSTASLGGGVGIGLVLILAGYLSLDAFKKRKNSYLAFVIETGTLFFFPFLFLDLVSLCCCKFCVFCLLRKWSCFC